MNGLRLEIQGPLAVQERQIAKNILLHYFGLRFRVNLLQFADDFLHGVFAVAALDDFEARTVEAQRAFRHEKNTLPIVFAKPAARSEAGIGIKIRFQALLPATNFVFGTCAPLHFNSRLFGFFTT